MTTSNPLRQFFRQPAIYLRLPSGGNFWPANSLDMPTNGELPVFPMTAIDEITYRTPDALFNGQAVVNVVESCIPNIKNAWHIPSQDFNAVMVAIRIASYGHNMDLTTTCPSCATEGDFGLDLRSVLDRLRSPDYGQSVQAGPLEISFRPMDYQQQNAISTEQFENQRMIQVIPDSDLAEAEKVQRMTDIMFRIQRLTTRVMAMTIASIRTPQAMVTESEFIQEFLENCDRDIYAAIRDQAVELRRSAELEPLPMKCGSCGHEHSQTLNLDQASFFVPAS